MLGEILAWERYVRGGVALFGAILCMCLSASYGLGLFAPPPPGWVAFAAFFGLAEALFSVSRRSVEWS